MPLLRNIRHERLAQEIVKGAKLEDAHRAAGLSGNRKSAWKIRQRADVIRRIEELLDQRDQVEAKVVERAISEAALTRTGILRMLVADHELARERGQLAAAIRAAELLGKILGVFIERSEQGKPGDFAHLSDEELDAQLTQRLKARGLTDKQIRGFLVGPHPLPTNSQEEAAGTLMLARRRISFS
jgi:phage terminase small subunit